jgi:NADH dehydrogenase
VILLTGATGFVGERVAHALRARDLPVRCLVRSRARAATLDAWGCELVEGDMTDVQTLVGAVEGCDTIVHLVAIIAGRPADFERVMSRGTTDLVAAAAGAGARRVVLMSALGVELPGAETVPYFRAKLAMERAVAESGLEHVVLRPSFVFGRTGGTLPRFARIVRYSPVTPVIGSGTQRIQPIWVDDLAAIVAAAVDRPEGGGTFELAGPDAVTWNELWERLARRLGKRRPLVHLPATLLRPQAALLERLPNPPLTRDQLRMLELGDNVCDIAPAVAAFGIEPIGLDEQLRRGLD